MTALTGVGCGDDGGNNVPTEDPCKSDSCDTMFYVTSMLDVGRASATGDPDIVPGFNIDGAVTAEGGDPTVCTNKKDFTSPAPDNEPGVDNQFGEIINSLSATGSFDITGSIEDAIADGSVVLLMQVEDIDDLVNDGNVTLSIFLGNLPVGVDMPTLGSDGKLQPGQTFDVDDNSLLPSGEPQVKVQGAIVNGRLRATTTAISLAISLSGENLTLNILDAEVRATMAAGAMSDGIIGGALDIQETVAAIDALMIDGISGGLVEGVLMGAADLEPDNDGFCQSVSLGLTFGGVTAVRGVVTTGD